MGVCSNGHLSWLVRTSLQSCGTPRRVTVRSIGPVLSALVKARCLSPHSCADQRRWSRADAHGLELVERHVRVADVIVNAACSDDLALHSVILAGQRERLEADGRPRGVLVHMSGGAISVPAGAYGLEGDTWKVRRHRRSHPRFWCTADKPAFGAAIWRMCALSLQA